MINIFLSRPSSINNKQQKGMDNFYSLLSFMDLKPRTLGVTDYPSKAPLDEVIKILDTCSGMIVLGFPQIYIKKGSLKESPIENIKLATEWNQIEATLAYSRQMPLLIIHDKGVERGIFDRGTLSGYIHEVDFNDENWSNLTHIKGALKTWQKDIDEYISKKKASCVAI